MPRVSLGVNSAKAQVVPLDELLDHQVFPILFRRLHYQGPVWAGAAQQFLVHLSVPAELAEDELLAGIPVPDEADAAPGALLQQADLLIFVSEDVLQPCVQHNHPRIKSKNS